MQRWPPFQKHPSPALEEASAMDGGREGFISEFYWVWLRRTLTFTIPKGPLLTGSFSQPNAMHLATLLPSSVNRDSRHRLVPGATNVAISQRFHMGFCSLIRNIVRLLNVAAMSDLRSGV